jgi:hypothetical protein
MARLKVAVLAPELIPGLVDVVIGDYVYELQFRVEKDNGDNPIPIDMDIDPKNDGDNGDNLGEEDDDPSMHGIFSYRGLRMNPHHIHQGCLNQW